MKLGTMTIVLPEQAKSKIDLDLVKLTNLLSKDTGCESLFGLGGKDGYGCNFENKVFMMHRYCWCEQDDCKWCGKKRYPNFYHKKSGLEIRFYKWIGRDMEYSRKVTAKEWKLIFKECIDSVSNASSER